MTTDTDRARKEGALRQQKQQKQQPNQMMSPPFPPSPPPPLDEQQTANDKKKRKRKSSFSSFSLILGGQKNWKKKKEKEKWPTKGTSHLDVNRCKFWLDKFSQESFLRILMRRGKRGRLPLRSTWSREKNGEKEAQEHHFYFLIFSIPSLSVLLERNHCRCRFRERSAPPNWTESKRKKFCSLLAYFLLHS